MRRLKFSIFSYLNLYSIKIIAQKLLNQYSIVLNRSVTMKCVISPHVNVYCNHYVISTASVYTYDGKTKLVM